MPRERLRACLQDGLKLDLNRLIRRGFVRLGEQTGPLLIQWLNSDTGEVRASGWITANLRGHDQGWFHFKSSSVDQRLTLAARPRHFGGRQWYFICPTTGRLASVLWKLPGSTHFRSRHTWGPRKVAYRSQFFAVHDRGYAGQAKIKARLIGDLDPADWALPPKPKWMRWRTYNRLVERFDAYEDMTYPNDFASIAKLMRRSG